MRIRSIKPEFWRSADIADLTVEDRLLFIGLWSYVDDNGVGRDVTAIIAADLFAFDLSRDSRDTLARVERGLANLSEAGRIIRYEVEGYQYLEIVNWRKHQRIDKPNKPRFPHADAEHAAIRDTLATPSRMIRETPAPGTEEQGNRGTGEQVDDSPVIEVTTDRAREISDQVKNMLAMIGVEWSAWVGVLAQHGITLRTDRDYVQLAQHLLGKTTQAVENPTGYVVACVRRNPLEVRTWATDTDSLGGAA